MTSRAKLSKTLRNERKRLGTWKLVSEELYGGEIHTAVLSRIANPFDKYWPKEKAIRDMLIPPLAPDVVGKRTLVIHATLDELHDIQNRIKDPRKRTEKIMMGWHYHDVDEFYE